MIYLNLGRREMGKTTLGLFIVNGCPRRLVFDPRGMIRTPNSNVFSDTRQHFQKAMDAFEAHEITEVVVTPRADVERAFAGFCREAANYVRKNPHARVGILIDEVRFVDLRNEDLDWILRCSSVENVHIVFTGHRPKDVPPDIRAIADRWLLFQFTLPGDVDIIDEQCSPRVAADVQRLKPREFVTWDDRIGKVSYHRDPSAWFVETRPKLANEPAPDTLPKGELDKPDTLF